MNSILPPSVQIFNATSRKINRFFTKILECVTSDIVKISLFLPKELFKDLNI